MKIKQRDDPRYILSNCNFLRLLCCNDHFFKPYFLNLIANYVECLDDATVAAQLEPTLIKAIKKGGFFRHNPSTFYSLISSKEDCVVCGRNCTPSVNCIWCVNVCEVGEKHKKMSRTSQIPPPVQFTLQSAGSRGFKPQTGPSP